MRNASELKTPSMIISKDAFIATKNVSTSKVNYATKKILLQRMTQTNGADFFRVRAKREVLVSTCYTADVARR